MIAVPSGICCIFLVTESPDSKKIHKSVILG